MAEKRVRVRLAQSWEPKKQTSRSPPCCCDRSASSSARFPSPPQHPPTRPSGPPPPWTLSPPTLLQTRPPCQKTAGIHDPGLRITPGSDPDPGMIPGLARPLPAFIFNAESTTSENGGGCHKSSSSATGTAGNPASGHGQTYFFDQQQRPELCGISNANNSDIDLHGHHRLFD